MSLTRSSLFLIILMQAIVCLPSFADSSNYRSKYGFDVKGFKPNQSARIGWIGGLRGARYFGTSQFYMGLGGYYGTPSGDSPSLENLYYGGITFGYDGKIGKVGIFELGVLAGYGEGEIKTMNLKQKSSYVVEPSMGIGFSLGLGWRVTLSASYLHMNGAPKFSGPTCGLRIDYRFSTQLKETSE